MNASPLGWRRLLQAVLDPSPERDPAPAQEARAATPVIWLLGKVQSGKTSIIRALTGADDAEIGQGFAPCTRHSRRYDFPPDAPLVTFLDTRGLGEVGVDPSAELALLEARSHAVVAVARAMDPSQQAVLDVLAAVRRRDPTRPVLLVQTRLHDGYPDGAGHPDPAALSGDPAFADLRRALDAQAAAFRGLGGPLRVVRVDLPRPEEGYGEFGLDDLLDAFDEVCAQGHGQLLRVLARSGRDSRLDRVRPHLLGYAASAGLSDLVPITAWVTVPAIQAKMLHSLARIHGRRWDRSMLTAFVASLGSGTALGVSAAFAARQLGKLVPVYGQSAGAAAAGAATAAVTYALGRAACEYLEQVRQGRSDPAAVARAWRGALVEAHALFRRQRFDAAP